MSLKRLLLKVSQPKWYESFSLILDCLHLHTLKILEQQQPPRKTVQNALDTECVLCFYHYAQNVL